jgi:hypothetical protein
VTTKRTEFGEIEHRLGERRSCVSEPPAPVCKERMERLREYIDAQQKSNAEALVNRAKEIDAHLANLNNAQARLDKDRDQFLRQELYLSEHRNLIERIDKISVKLSNVELWRAALEGKASRANVISIFAMVITTIFALLHFYQGVR